MIDNNNEYGSKQMSKQVKFDPIQETPYEAVSPDRRGGLRGTARNSVMSINSIDLETNEQLQQTQPRKGMFDIKKGSIASNGQFAKTTRSSRFAPIEDFEQVTAGQGTLGQRTSSVDMNDKKRQSLDISAKMVLQSNYVTKERTRRSNSISEQEDSPYAQNVKDQSNAY